MIYIKLQNGEEFSFENADIIDIKSENSFIIVSVSQFIKSVCCESKYFFRLSDIRIFQCND